VRLNLRGLTTGLRFHGEVEGKRQHYYVLSSDRHYFVMSLSRAKRDAGNFNLVAKPAVEQLYRRLHGQRGVTAKRVFTRTRNRRQVPTSLAALNMLYVLVATDRAKIDARRVGTRELFFNVKA
jgi:hypothetical protein